MRLSILVALFVSSPAYAGFDEFASAFPVFPCMDGWMACKVGTANVSPDLQADAAGRPVVSSARVSFWDLEPTAAFSPFSTLSGYTGEVVPKREVEPPAVVNVAPPIAPVAIKEVEVKQVKEVADAKDVKQVPDPKEIAVVKDTSKEVAVGKDAVKDVSVEKEVAVVKEVLKESAIRPGSSDFVKDGGTEPVVAVTKMVVPEGCDELSKLEPPAMLGKLAESSVTCLEGRLASASLQTEKDKISRVLMANAWAKGDKATWEKLVKRHLTDIDGSDPDIAYKYAEFLSKKGAARGSEAIKWSEVALERKTVWTGDTYVKRVGGLQKIRAASAQSLWKTAEESYAANPTEQGKKDADGWRSKTKVYAREWYEYQVSAGADSTIALQLCVAAAGTDAYCTGG